MIFVRGLQGVRIHSEATIFSTLPLSKESILPSMLLLLCTASLPLLHWFCTTASAAPRLLLHWVLGLQSSTLPPDLQASTLPSGIQASHWSSSTNTATCPLSIITASGPRVSLLLPDLQVPSLLPDLQVFFSAFRSSSVTTASAALYWPLSFPLNLYVLRSFNQLFSIPEKVTTSYQMCYPFSKFIYARSGRPSSF